LALDSEQQLAPRKSRCGNGFSGAQLWADWAVQPSAPPLEPEPEPLPELLELADWAQLVPLALLEHLELLPQRPVEWRLRSRLPNW
jgi:hypothetical protein